MNEFENLKRSYIEAIRLGMACQTGYDETKNGNELLHKFCSIHIEPADYREGSSLDKTVNHILVKMSMVNTLTAKSKAQLKAVQK